MYSVFVLLEDVLYICIIIFRMPSKHKIIVVSIDLLSHLLSRAAGVLVQIVIYRYNCIYLSPAADVLVQFVIYRYNCIYSSPAAGVLVQFVIYRYNCIHLSPAAGVLVESKDTIVFI